MASSTVTGWKGGRPLVWSLLALFAVLSLLPIVVLVIGSFLVEPPRALHFDFSHITFANYLAIVPDIGSLGLVFNTFVGAALGTIGAVVIGSLLAWLAVRTDVPGRRILEAVAIIPMLIPPLVGAFAWEMLASPKSGMLNIFARSAGLPTTNVYSFLGVCFVYSIYYAPYIYLMMAAALRNLDPAVEEAASICGAGRFYTMTRVTIPLVAPALLSSALLVFIFLIEVFAIPAVLGEPGNAHFMSVRIYDLIAFAPPKVNEASALGVLMLIVTMALVIFQHRVLAKRSYVTVAGKGMRPRRLKLGAWRWPVAVVGFVYIALVVILPYAALILIAFRKSMFFSTVARMLDPSQLSLHQFVSTLTDPLVAVSLKNSLVVSASTVVIGSCLYFMVSYVTQRTRLRGRQALDLLAMMPLAIPGLIIGLGYLWVWISFPIGIYGTVWVIVLAYISQFSPQGVRAISASLVQIHPELEEGARICGAGFAYILRRVVVPLAWPGIQSAMILLLVFSFREVATALFLYTSTTQVFSVTMFDYWGQGTTGSVAVMTLVQTVLLLAVILVGRALQGDGGAEASAAAK